METIGRNVQAEVKDGKLTLTIDLSVEGQPSASGKTKVLATTSGFVNVGGVLVGLNVCRK
jgi:hypothetical protein